MDKLIFTVHKFVTEIYYFRLRTETGGLLLTSREYPGLHKCLNEVYSLQVHNDFILEENDSASALTRYSFCLMNPVGVILAKSPEYISLAGMLQDMDMITTSIHEAEIEDRCTKVRFFRPVNVKR